MLEVSNYMRLILIDNGSPPEIFRKQEDSTAKKIIFLEQTKKNSLKNELASANFALNSFSLVENNAKIRNSISAIGSRRSFI